MKDTYVAVYGSTRHRTYYLFSSSMTDLLHYILYLHTYMCKIYKYVCMHIQLYINIHKPMTSILRQLKPLAVH